MTDYLTFKYRGECQNSGKNQNFDGTHEKKGQHPTTAGGTSDKLAFPKKTVPKVRQELSDSLPVRV